MTPTVPVGLRRCAFLAYLYSRCTIMRKARRTINITGPQYRTVLAHSEKVRRSKSGLHAIAEGNPAVRLSDHALLGLVYEGRILWS